MRKALSVAFVALCLLVFAGCSGGSSSGNSGGTVPTPPPSTSNEWTWESGSSTLPVKGIGQTGVYGTEGVASTTNVPGGRTWSVSWTDSNNNFWLFGGTGIDSSGSYGGLNDLWTFSPASKEWTWVSGSKTANAVGVYGTQGTASAANVPGSLMGAVSWIDKSGDLWLFGGGGRDSAGYSGLVNDLWEFNPMTKEWTWVSGSVPSNTQVGQTGTFAGQAGVYGSLGVPTGTNTPGSRYGSVSWTDSAGNLWLFGGTGIDSTGTEGYLNDLWEFNPSSKEWTWISGSSTTNAPGVYGTQGTASAANVPGGRAQSVSWIDPSGNLWLFGGTGSNAVIDNDLWEFNPTAKTWTWISGSKTANAVGVYGTQGAASAANVPGARYGSIPWTDSSGNFWLFGGEVFNQSNATYAQINDLWTFNPTSKEWTWANGANTAGVVGVYGTLGSTSASNAPGARWNAVGWIDTSGNLWLFGGNYSTSDGTVQVDFNDLWKYQTK